MEIFILVLLGLAFGSFVTALTWRLHEHKNFITGRSQCEKCGHVLGVLDLLPIISWLILKGRCRYCNKKFGWENPLIELSMVVLFVVSYLYWPIPLHDAYAWISFALWLVYSIFLVALLVYDLKWMLLPNTLVFPLIGLGLIDAVVRVSAQPDFTVLVLLQHIALGAVALGGFYWVLYTVSKGSWIGYGDVKLGFFMGIVLGWQQALVTLFLANIIGFFIIIPALLLGKVTAKSRVPFGPFLIAAFFVTGLFGEHILSWYLSFFTIR